MSCEFRDAFGLKVLNDRNDDGVGVTWTFDRWSRESLNHWIVGMAAAHAQLRAEMSELVMMVLVSLVVWMSGQLLRLLQILS